jgi:hypothetical protein
VIFYTYNNITPKPNLEAFDVEVNASAISTGLPYLGCDWNVGCNTIFKPPCTPQCEQPCNGLLNVAFTGDLSSGDKTTLDTIVSHY